MKKTFLIISLTTLLFTSCSFFQKKEEVPQAESAEIKLETHEGIVTTPMEQNLISAPTDYLLLTESQEKIFIQSAAVNLNRYHRRRVEVEGKKNDDGSIFIVENVTSLRNETAIKTKYKNGALGVSFDYPSVWVLKEEKNAADETTLQITPFESSEGTVEMVDRIAIGRSENNRRVTLRKWLNLDENYKPLAIADESSKVISLGDTAVYQQSAVGVAQLDAVKKTIQGGTFVEFYVARDTWIYIFSHKSVNDADKDLYRNAFFDLLNSFEFIPFSNAPEEKKPSPLTAVPEPSPPPPVSPVTITIPPAPSPPEATSQATTSSRQTFITYIQNNIGTLAPEPPAEGKTWAVSRIEFAFPEGQPDAFSKIYVIYSNGVDRRRISLAIWNQTDPRDGGVTVAAYFKPGETTDWELVSGSDVVKGLEKTVVTLGTSGTSEVTVKKGMTLLDARSFKIKIQYPSNFYWAYVSSEYHFSDKPVADDNVLIRLLKNPASTADMLCVKKTAATFCLSGEQEQTTVMQQMLATIQE